MAAFLAYAPQLALGAVETIGALKGMKELGKQQEPSYTSAKIMAPLKEAEDIYRRGYTRGLEPETIALAQQQQATETAGMARRIGDISGGQLSSVTSRLGALDRVRTSLGLAQQDIAYRRAMAGGLSSALRVRSSQEMAEAQRQEKRSLMTQQALGGALRAGLQSMGNALTMGAYSYAQGMLKNKATQTPETQAVAEDIAQKEPIFNFARTMPSRGITSPTSVPPLANPGLINMPAGINTIGRITDLSAYKNIGDGVLPPGDTFPTLHYLNGYETSGAYGGVPALPTSGPSLY